MDGAEIARRRLVNHHLTGPRLADPVAVVRHFGAVQAQEYPLARWALGQRCTGFDDHAIHHAVDSGQIVRVHALRPTWHFVAAADLHWIQAVTGARVHGANAFYYRQHGLTTRIVDQTCRAITGALAAGGLTRAELGAALAADGVEATGNKLAYLVMLCELDGHVVNGPMRGKQHTYALAEHRIAQPWSPEDGPAELARRYFTSHGPATVKDFAWWSSLTITQARAAMSTVELQQYDVDGVRFYGPAGEDPGPIAGVHVLPVYDEYVVAYSESRWAADLAGRKLGFNSLVNAILLDTQIIGVWRRTVERGTLAISATVSGRLTAKLRRAIEAKFDEYAGFCGLQLSAMSFSNQ
jgi:hypothetical protein